VRSPSCTQIDEKKARVLFARERERENTTTRQKTTPRKTRSQKRLCDDDDDYYYFTHCVRVVGAFGSIENGRPAFMVVVSLLR